MQMKVRLTRRLTLLQSQNFLSVGTLDLNN